MIIFLVLLETRTHWHASGHSQMQQNSSNAATAIFWYIYTGPRHIDCSKLPTALSASQTVIIENSRISAIRFVFRGSHASIRLLVFVMFAVAFALENPLSYIAFGLGVHERVAPAGNSSRIERILYAAAREIRSRVLVYVFAFDLVSMRSPR